MQKNFYIAQIRLAKKYNASILSLDSLSIYKEIDIVSAKPTLQERSGITHYGIDYIYPNEIFDVTTFIKLYHKAYQNCQKEKKNLIIVGGTSFYLKMLIDGISHLPTITQKTKEIAKQYLLELEKTYQWLYALDNVYMSNIASNDRYRIEKILHIYLETKLTPTDYFKQNPVKQTITAPLPIYQIIWDRSLLKERIYTRSQLMLEEGLIDEVCLLEKKYSRKPNCMKAIGIKETLDYLDGRYDKEMLLKKISTNTARLAKRQTTFNNSQFENVTKGSVEALEKILL